MFGSGVLTYMVPIRVALRVTRMVHLQRQINSVVFAAVRGTAAIRTTSGALIVAGGTQVAGAASAASVFPQDLVRILFSGAAFSGPFAGSGVLHQKTSAYRRFRRRKWWCSVMSNM